MCWRQQQTLRGVRYILQGFASWICEDTRVDIPHNIFQSNQHCSRDECAVITYPMKCDNCARHVRVLSRAMLGFSAA